MMRLLACGVVLLGLVVGCGDSAAPQDTSAADRAAIESGLRQFPRDFNARDYPAMCALFAEDAVLSYPDDGPDRGRDVFCARMRKLLSDPAKQFSYSEPDIREVLVDGDLATVAFTWTLTMKDAAGKVVGNVEEDGLDVFRRQPDGSWKIHISHGFPNCHGVKQLPC